MNITVARMLGGVGRTLIGAGIVILLFVVYQLWGTGIQEARAQGSLDNEFEKVLQEFETLTKPEGSVELNASTSVPPTTLANAEGGSAPDVAVAQPTAPAEPEPLFELTEEQLELLYPAKGNPIAVIEIPKLGVSKLVVEGVEVEDLKRGPGHYPDTPLPGQTGNASIAGHRTTYGAPFGDVDKLVPGDEIRIKTVQGDAVYRVSEQPYVVKPTEVHVLNDFGDNRLTLTACHPKFSARQRIIVNAELISEPFTSPPKPEDTRTTSIVTGRQITEAGAVNQLDSDPAAPSGSSNGQLGADEFENEAAAEGADSESTDSGGALSAGSDVPAPDQPTATTTALPVDVTEDTATDLDAGLAGDSSAWTPAIGWGLLTAAVAAAAWFIGKLWRERSATPKFKPYIAYAMASPIVGTLLYQCFFHVDRLLPAY